jgi:trehalose 6-phosphate synthase/phosphatase
VRSERGELSVTPSQGGLATGLGDLHAAGEGLWIGWPGETWRLTGEQHRALEARLDPLRLLPVELSSAEVERYYDGFANGVLWPLLHAQLDRLPLTPRGWETYRRVNQRFADVVVATARPGDLIWVHDYQLALLPALIRQRLPRATIGFFLHVPFPPADLVRVLPWRREFLEGILGASLIGLHTAGDAGNLRGAAIGIAGARPDRGGVVQDERRVRIKAFPMGVDAPRWDALARSSQVNAYIDRVHEELGGARMIVSVDRLDYTKGVLRRILAFERLLERNPTMRGRVRLVQVAAPSREAVGAYRTYRSAVDEEIGRVNGRFATVGQVPIHALGRAVAQEHIVALYRAASVALVTPLRDGMNLVAKEFAASRIDGDGVLVLSEFAGAAAELTGALLVNPYDIEGTAATIRRALDMPAPERRTRMELLRSQVRRFDLRHWADAFVAGLRESADPVSGRGSAVEPSADEGVEPAGLRTPEGVSGISSPDELAAVLAAPDAGPLALLIAYDGTLVGFQRKPDAARPDHALRELLGDLAALPDLELHLVSGRRRAELERWFGDLPIGLHAEHGLWSRFPGQSAWQRRQDPPTWLADARPILEAAVRDVPGSHVEVKDASLAWHWRAAAADLAEPRARRLAARLRRVLADAPAELVEGDHVLEVRPAGIDKGLIVRSILQADRIERALLVGDDRTDEDMFAVARPGDLTVHVGPGPSRAAFRLAGPAEVRGLLVDFVHRWRRRETVDGSGKQPRSASGPGKRRSADRRTDGRRAAAGMVTPKAAGGAPAARPNGPRAARSGGARRP